MNNKLVIVLVVQFMLVCAPLSWQAAALERDQDSVQQCSLSRKPSEECPDLRDTSRVKDNRQALLRHQKRVRIMPSQSDLLQQLLPPGEIKYGSNRLTEEINKLHRSSYKRKEMETGFLEELIVETSP
jgi:hypothetical protein